MQAVGDVGECAVHVHQNRVPFDDMHNDFLMHWAERRLRRPRAQKTKKLSRVRDTSWQHRVHIVERLIIIRAMQSISREDLKQSISRGDVILVDARSPEKFNKSHLPGSINIPAGRAADLSPMLLPDKLALVVTYCVNFTWKLSEQLARELEALGYENVRNYQEGRQDWMAAGLPLEGSAPYEPVKGFQPSESEAEAEKRLRPAS
jgi:rhodanese-related sulfurtransferase